MRTTTAVAFFSIGIAIAVGELQVQAVTFDWATVGNPGNAPDDTGFGPVDYAYRISKYEVTNAQYTEFLNAVAATDTNSLYDTAMGIITLGGIVRSGSSGSYTYAVKPDSIGSGPGGADGDDYTYGDKPVMYVSFIDAMRFTNWLENGQPIGAQDVSTTENGIYEIGSGVSEERNPNATYFIPNEDEWYKAAYYDPNNDGGVYYDYPTSTDLEPNNNLPSFDTGNSANFWQSGTTTGGFTYPLTDVGAFMLSDSPYGTFDQGGNVWEWNEGVFDSSARGARGGVWDQNSDNLLSSVRIMLEASFELENVGFRVGTSIIPEPNTLVLTLAATFAPLFRRRPTR